MIIRCIVTWWSHTHFYFQEASLLAKDTLVPTNPIRLALAFNYAAFHYEILHSRLEYFTASLNLNWRQKSLIVFFNFCADVTTSIYRAIKLTNQAIDDAVAGLDHLNDETKKKSTSVIQRLKNNLNLWASDPLGVGGMIFDWEFLLFYTHSVPKYKIIFPLSLTY